ncbi:MAG: SUMF1/EgtB/PvdO family nonheme iron enzyme [Lentisphaeria bacterium]|nr:SUMF1/EgtB/PvdO family nonheme iron enzyme [Lentisphaeria bacterium]
MRNQNTFKSHRLCAICGFMMALLVALPFTARANEPYAEVLEALRAEIHRLLPRIDEATRKRIEETRDNAERIPLVKALPAVEAVLSSDALDAKLAKFAILRDATPTALAEFASQGAARKALIDALLADDELMLQIAVADGARPVEARDSVTASYGRVMEIYDAIQKASSKAQSGIYQRLALAVALEYSESAAADIPKAVVRYGHYVNAYEAGELDPNFPRFSVWELRFVVCAPESDETLAWGREMLRNFRPDHIYTENEGWRYANVVNTDVRYGSIDVGKDRPELAGMQNILMNGGICGRRAFFARYICRAFGIPATPRPSPGHGASARWTPEGWVVVLGPRWGAGKSPTRYRSDLDFLATTQARARGTEFLKVKRAYWIGDVMGEERCYAEFDKRAKPGFWNAVALATQRRLIEESDAVPLDALGAELGEASGKTVAQELAATDITPDARKITQGIDGTITLPAAAYRSPKGNTDDVIAMKSFAGGLQVFLPRFLQQKPILVRGGSWRHEADLCASATRHWRGSRPKKSHDLRGMRVVVMPGEGEPTPALTLEIAPSTELGTGDGVSMEFVYIPPGTFIMGGIRQQKEGDVLADTPKHEVTLTQGFYLGKYEVTQTQYEAVMNKKKGSEPNHPVSGVKPYTALLFCDELSSRTGLEVRLPTEAEWEYAARAGTSTRYFFGDDSSTLSDYAWFEDNAGGQTHPVGQKKPNPWGLYDIYGNVAEFVRDEHSEDYYANSPKEDPTGPSLGINSSMEFAVSVPKAGIYSLTARVATSNVEQSLQLAVNGSEDAIHIALPFTIGLWGESEPVTLRLNQGENILRFWRDQAPQYGVALKAFALKTVGGE